MNDPNLGKYNEVYKPGVLQSLRFKGGGECPHTTSTSLSDCEEPVTVITGEMLSQNGLPAKKNR